MIQSLRILTNNSFVLFLLFLIATCLSILLNIPLLRPALGFFFLTFIPGLLILHILRLTKLGLTEKIVLSIGLSVSFAMFFGLIVNSVSLALGYVEPLSTASLLISFSIATIVLAVVAYIRNKNITFSSPNLKLTTREKAFLILPALFPLLSIAGMRIMNLTDSNALLMLLLFLIPAYVIFISFYRHKVPPRLYPSLLYLIGISLTLMLSLRSNHVMGSDIHLAYYAFQTTLDNLHWSVTTPSLVDTCLSISLLPSIYHTFLNINQEYLFKVLYSLLFSISPLVVYIIAKKYIGNFYAFIASFFFMSQFYFLWTASTAQTNTAILFFALAIMVLFHEDINEFARRLLLIIFAAACIVSHYSGAYIFLFILLLTWIGMQTIPKIFSHEKKAVTLSKNPVAGRKPYDLLPDREPLRSSIAASKPPAVQVTQSQLKMGISISLVVLFFVMLFFWYSQITLVAFRVGVDFIHHTFANLNQWFLLESKGSVVVAAVGKSALPTIPQQIRLVFSWLTIILIAIGALSTIVRYKRMIAIPGSAYSKPDFLQSKFTMEYFTLSLACVAILVLSVVLPYVSKGYDMGRIYFQMMAVLSPFFTIGGIMVAKWLRARPHWIILVVLVPFFMCTTGTMYQIFGVPASIALNSEGMEYETHYVHDQESYAAGWIREYGRERAKIYTVAVGRMLVSQARATENQIKSLVARYREGQQIDGYIYLGYKDTTVDKVVTKYPDIFAEKSKIYASGGSEIYR